MGDAGDFSGQFSGDITMARLAAQAPARPWGVLGTGRRSTAMGVAPEGWRGRGSGGGGTRREMPATSPATSPWLG